MPPSWSRRKKPMWLKKNKGFSGIKYPAATFAGSARQHTSSAHQPTSSAHQPTSSVRKPVSSAGSFASTASPRICSREMEDDSEEEEEDELDDVIMALDKNGCRIGCCYYIIGEEKLFLMEDIELPGIDCIDALKFQIKPTILLLPSRFDEELEKSLNPDPTDQYATPYRILIRPGGEFAYETAKSKLVALRIGETSGPTLLLQVPGDMTEGTGEQKLRGNLLRLAGWINVDSRVTVGCAGAVLTYLQRKQAISRTGDGSNDRTAIASIEMFSMADAMFVNADTICSLQVFENESHPNFHMQGRGGRGKEGLSLFGILNTTKSPMGHALLKQWFLRPVLKLSIIRERQDSIACLLRGDNTHVTDALRKSLCKVKNIPKVIVGLKKGTGGAHKGGEWSSVLQFAFHTLKIRTALQDLSGGRGLEIYKKVMQEFEVLHLQNIGQIITDIIDFEESALQHKVVVKRNVNDELDHMKSLYDGMDSMLSEVARQIAADVPDDVATRLNVIYFPQLGYLIVVPGVSNTSGDSSRDGVTVNTADTRPAYVGSSWDFQFSTATSWYYKNSQMREMDEYFGDLYTLICNREIDIVHDLQVRVLVYESILVSCARVCAELDCLVALAAGAAMHKYTRPVVVEENVIEIKSGRHPLQELCVSAYVENDTLIAGGRGEDTPERKSSNKSTDSEDETPSMIILTGPNYSGKSVYIKQVALIVYMAHIGSYVPADSAIIGITDSILTRIQTRESVSKLQSAFMIDLSQISQSLRLATHRSLLCIDEFGKGTDSSDGAGLAAAVLEHLISLENRMPKILAATHYHEIFEHGFLPECPAFHFAHMRIVLDPEAESVDGQITYLYKLESGRSTSSFGTCCAALNSINPEIVARAEDLILLAARGEDLVAACGALSEGERRELEESEAAGRLFLNEFGGFEEDVQDEDTREKLGRVLEGLTALEDL